MSMNRLRAWFADHARVCVAALGRLSRDPAGSLLTTLVIGLTLALPAALHLLVDNLESAAGGLEESRALTLFLNDALGEPKARDLLSNISARKDIAKARLTTRTQALDEFRKRTDLGPLIEALDENPLPASIRVVPSRTLGDAELAVLARELGAEPGVAQVQRDQVWTERLSAALAVLSRLALVLALGLGLAVAIAIGNTIRLEIAARRDEIAVLQLIGAPPGFIRRPFLYAGLWFGLSGGVLAVIAVQIARLSLDGPVSRWVELYEGGFALHGLSLQAALGLVGTALALGLVGAWLAVSRHLGDFESR